MSDTALLNLSIGTKKALSNLNRFNNEVNKVGKTVSLKLSAPLLALETIAVKTFSEMESGLTDITNLLDKGEGFEAYEETLGGVQEQAIELGFAIDDVNKSLFDNVSALGQGEQALEAYEEAQKLAIGGNAQLSETVNGLTSVINAYGRETTKASDVSNAFFTAQKKGKTTVSELANNIGKVAPIAKSAGIGFKELLATMSTLTLGGLSTDEATTSLRSTISALVKPTKDAEKVLRSLSVPVGALELKEKGLGFALNQLNKAQEENADLLAQAIPNIRALTGVTSFSADKLKILSETQEQMNEDIENGTGLNEAYIASMNDLGKITQQALGVIKTLGEAFGEMFVEGADLKTMFKDFTENVKGFKEQIKELSPEQKKFYSWMISAAIVIPPVTAGVTGLAASLVAMKSTAIAANIALAPLLVPLLAITGAAVAGATAGWSLADALVGESEAVEQLRESIKKLNEERFAGYKEDSVRQASEHELWELQKKRIEDTFKQEEENHKKIAKLRKEELEGSDFDSFINDMMENLDFVNEFMDTGDEKDGSKDGAKSARGPVGAILKNSAEAFQKQYGDSNELIQKDQLKFQKKIAKNTESNSTTTFKVASFT